MTHPPKAGGELYISKIIDASADLEQFQARSGFEPETGGIQINPTGNEVLVDHLGDYAGTNRTTAFTNRKA